MVVQPLLVPGKASQLPMVLMLLLLLGTDLLPCLGAPPRCSPHIPSPGFPLLNSPDAAHSPLPDLPTFRGVRVPRHPGPLLARAP